MQIELPSWLYHKQCEPTIVYDQERLDGLWAEGYRDIKPRIGEEEIVEEDPTPVEDDGISKDDIIEEVVKPVARKPKGVL